MTYMDYETRIERCKRQDSTQKMIICLDKASAENHEQVVADFLTGMFLGGAVLLVLGLIWFIARRG